MKKFIEWVKSLFKTKYTQLKREDIISDNNISGGYFDAIKELQNKIEDVRIVELRKQISIAAMQGLLSTMTTDYPDPPDVAKWSIEYANALIEALNKSKTNQNV